MSAVGTSSSVAMIGPRFSAAIDSRSRMSREPACSNELISIRHRIHAKARRILSTLDPIERRAGALATHQADEDLLERAFCRASGTKVGDGTLRDQRAFRSEERRV